MQINFYASQLKQSVQCKESPIEGKIAFTSY